MDWFYLALIAPLLWAIVNILDDNLLHHVYKGPYFGAAVSGIFGVLPLASLLILRVSDVSIATAAFGTLAGFLLVLQLFFYFNALKKGSPSVVIAMFSFTPSILPIFAYFFLGERLSATQLAGFFMIIIASLSLALVEFKGWRQVKFNHALGPTIIAALLLDAVALLSKHLFNTTNFYTGYMYISIGMGIGGFCFLIAMVARHKYEPLPTPKNFTRKFLGLIALAELLSILADFTQKLAISRGPVSLVDAIAGIQPVYVLAIALIFYPFAPKYFREAAEGGLTKKFVLMLLIVFGLLLISN